MTERLHHVLFDQSLEGVVADTRLRRRDAQEVGAEEVDGGRRRACGDPLGPVSFPLIT